MDSPLRLIGEAKFSEFNLKTVYFSPAMATLNPSR